MSTFSELIGLKIEKLFGDKDTLGFRTSDKDFVYTAYGDCCSTSWFEHVSGIDFLVGHTVQSVEDISLPEITDPKELSDHECLQQYGYRITTDKGYFLVEMRNSSNGYYGGSVDGPNGSCEKLKELTEDF